MGQNHAHFLKHPVFKVASQIAAENNMESFVIGGFVRDSLLERETKDIDIVVIGDGPSFAKAVAEKLRVKQVSIFKNFGTAHFKYKDLDIEFVGARKESYSSDSRKPITESGTLSDDQKRRDFTINALALNLNSSNYGDLIDPFNGLQDLERGIIRTPLSPASTYSDDPLRMMRAIRFACQLGFTIEKSSLEAIFQEKERIQIISMERIMDEFNKIMLSEKPSRGLLLLKSSGLLSYFFQEIIDLYGIEKRNNKSHKDNFYHTLEVVDNLATTSTNLWLRWAALLHDIAKPATKRFDETQGWTFHGHEELGARMVPKIFNRLKLPLDSKMKYVQKLVRLHLRPIALVKGTVTDSAIRRLLSEAGDDIDDLMLLCNADITSKNEHKVAKYKNNFTLVSEKLLQVEEKDKVRNFQPPISGEHIMKTFGIAPCSEIGWIKSHIKEAILEGKIENTFEQAEQEMFLLANQLGMVAQNQVKK